VAQNGLNKISRLHDHRVTIVLHALSISLRASRHFHFGHASLLLIRGIFGVAARRRLLRMSCESTQCRQSNCNHPLVSEPHGHSFAPSFPKSFGLIVVRRG
jgi:hypothetical protein